MIRIKFTGTFNFDNLCSKPGCHVESKAFSMSKNNAAVDIFLLKFKVIWSVSLIHWSVVLWRARNPNWLAFSKLLESRCLWTIFWMTFSNSWPILDKRLIGLKLCGNFGSLPGFGKVIIFASFQEPGKCDSFRQWLNTFVEWTRGLSGMCLSHSFGMPSITEAFFSFREFINFFQVT